MEDRQRKKQLILKVSFYLGVILAASALVLFVVLFAFRDYFWGNTSQYEDDGEDKDINIQEAIAIYNQEFIDKSAGRERTAPMYRCLQNVFLSEDEKKTAPHKNESPEGIESYYGATILKETLKGYIVTPQEWTYQVSIKISDGRVYDWYYRLNTNYEYAYSVIRNNKSNSYNYCPSDRANISKSEVLDWLENSMKISPESLANFNEFF